MVTMAPLLLEVPWDVEGTITAYHVTRTLVSNVWSCTDVQRTRPSAAYSVNSVGRWDELLVCGSPEKAHFTATWPCVKDAASEAFPAGGGAPR